MRYIANKPCSFCGKKFFIGDEIPAEMVSNPKAQEKLGIITIANGTEGVPGGGSGTFTAAEVEAQLAEAVAEANSRTEEAERKLAEVEAQLAEAQSHVAELAETEPGAYEGVVPIVISTEGDEAMSLPMTPEEIQQVVTIRQFNADDAIKAIAEVTSENVLILIHAIEERKTVKEAAKKQVDSLFPTNGNTNESSNGNASTGTNTEGADT